MPRGNIQAFDNITDLPGIYKPGPFPGLLGRDWRCGRGSDKVLGAPTDRRKSTLQHRHHHWQSHGIASQILQQRFGRLPANQQVSAPRLWLVTAPFWPLIAASIPQKLIADNRLGPASGLNVLLHLLQCLQEQQNRKALIQQGLAAKQHSSFLHMMPHGLNPHIHLGKHGGCQMLLGISFPSVGICSENALRQISHHALFCRHLGLQEWKRILPSGRQRLKPRVGSKLGRRPLAPSQAQSLRQLHMLIWPIPCWGGLLASILLFPAPGSKLQLFQNCWVVIFEQNVACTRSMPQTSRQQPTKVVKIESTLRS